MTATPKTPREEVQKFRVRHSLDQAELDRLMGFSSNGRSTRRWEAEDAPYYVTILMRYVDTFGIEIMETLALERERACKNA